MNTRLSKRRKTLSNSAPNQQRSARSSPSSPSHDTVNPASLDAQIETIQTTSRSISKYTTDVDLMGADDNIAGGVQDHPALEIVSAVTAVIVSEPVPQAWPAQRIPVEIFNIIIQFVSRRDIQMMRLVNHEFDAKLSEIYFSVVVVPFRPEFESLYGQLNLKTFSDQAQDKDYDRDDPSQNPPNDGLISTGHRVFEQFGDKMRKFALALEINETDLANPPLKMTQEIHAAPWGLYRWPVMNYQRFTEVESIERLANETGYMLRAFQHLKCINEIGISCDAGLGWLHGPDTNRFYAATQPPVFRPITYDAADLDNSVGSWDTESQSIIYLKQMASNAGYPPEHWPQVILRLLEDEGRAGVTKWVERIRTDGKLIRERVPTFKIKDNTSSEAIMTQVYNGIPWDEDDETAEGGAESVRAGAGQLVPCNLTQAQSEMLLELEWAHRALMQSYRLALLDNKDNFQNLTTLNIARCPSSRITTWCNEEFWETMTSIETFHLGVIPDWRQLHKYNNDTIVDRKLQPSSACGLVFQLLQSYVCEQDNIKHISFEWVCGGEFATGKSQRDRYILPAPVLSASAKMVATHTFQPDEILNMPYATKLSLKNCWFSPHVFTWFLEHLFLEALEDIVLESVSLSGPLSTMPELSIYSAPHSRKWPWPLCVGAEPGNWFQLSRPNNVQQQVNQAWAAAALQAAPAFHGAGAAFGGPYLAAQFAAVGLVPQGVATIQAQGQAGQPAHLGAMGHMHPAVAQAGIHHNQGTIAAAVPINHSDPPAQPHVGSFTGKWRPWSWPHILARLGMAPEAIHQYLENSGAEGKDHLGAIKATENDFEGMFRNIFGDRNYHGKHQSVKFRSCGYALINAPYINNWKIIPCQPERVHHTSEFATRLKELDIQMQSTEDYLLAKIINYMPEEEEHFLRSLFHFELGWDNVYDPVVKQAAIADGNPRPGQARFSGATGNNPATVEGMKQMLKGKGRLVESYRF